jgi:hypothetical protein
MPQSPAEIDFYASTIVLSSYLDANQPALPISNSQVFAMLERIFRVYSAPSPELGHAIISAAWRCKAWLDE